MNAAFAFRTTIHHFYFSLVFAYVRAGNTMFDSGNLKNLNSEKYSMSCIDGATADRTASQQMDIEEQPPEEFFPVGLAVEDINDCAGQRTMEPVQRHDCPSRIHPFLVHYSHTC